MIQTYYFKFLELRGLKRALPAKINMSAEGSFWRRQVKISFLTFLAFQKFNAFLILSPSSIFEAKNGLSNHSLLPPFSSYRDPHDYIWTTQIIQFLTGRLSDFCDLICGKIATFSKKYCFCCGRSHDGSCLWQCFVGISLL